MTRYAFLYLTAPLLFSATLPAHFEPFADGFLARTNLGAYYVTGSGALRFPDSSLEMKFLGASETVLPEPSHATTGKSNYLRGSDPARWRTGVAQFADVRFRQLYPGVDLIYHASPASALEYDLAVGAGVSPRRVAMQFKGADSVRLDANGGLIVRAGKSDLHLDRPRISQDDHTVRGGYRLLGGNRVAFWIGKYDRTRPLLIDPVIGAFATFGTSGVRILGMATDASGNLYVAGNENASFPVANAIQPNPGTGNCGAYANDVSPCQDVFIAKLDPTGTKIIYSTYLGDNGADWFGGLAVDAHGNAYLSVTGYSANYYSSQPLTGGHAFVRKLSPDGASLLYDKSIGANTLAAGIALDPSGNAFVTGASSSATFPAVHAIQPNTVIKPMFVTKDGGATWNPISVPAMQVNMLAIPPGQSTTLYAATPVGLFKSLDSGASWTNLIPTAAGVTAVVLDPQTPSTVYAAYGTATSTPGSVILARSTDAGSSWTSLSGIPPDAIFDQPPPIAAVAIDPENSSTIWIATAGLDARITKSLDGGKTWQIVFGATPVPPPFPFSPSELLIDPTSSSHVYACCANRPGGGVYFTQDAGVTWVEGSTGMVAGSSGVHAPVLDPSNHSVLYATWYYGLQRSSDGGQTWANVTLPSVPQNLNNVLISSSGVLYVISDAGYFLRSADRGVTWTLTQGPWVLNSTLLAIDPMQPGTVYVSSPQTQIQDAFAVKLDGAGNTLWATLLGGSGNDAGQGIAVDSNGNAYITGTTSSSDFPIVKAVQSALGDGIGNQSDAFASEISADGSTLIYSTYLGGRYADSGVAIAVDGSGNAYVGGTTQSLDFPLAGPMLTTGGGFLAEISAGGQKLAFSTYLVAPPSAMAADANGSLLVGGGGGFLPPNQPLQESSGGGFVSRWATPGNLLQFSTPIGGFGCGAVSNLAFGTAGSFWIAGAACATDFPSLPTTQSQSSGSPGNYLARIDLAPPAAQPGVPRIDGVYNGGSFQLGDVVAPGEVVTLVGANLASSSQRAATAPLPLSLLDASVAIGGTPAPLYYVSPSQINLQVPTSLALGITDLTVTRGANVTHRAVNVTGLRPGIFFVNGVPAVTHSSDYSLVTPDNFAHPGEYLVVFCSGFGPSSPSVPAGAAAPLALSPIPGPVFVVVGGREVTATYAGLAPGTIGLYQINFQLPSDTSLEPTDLYIMSTYQGTTNDVPLYVH